MTYSTVKLAEADGALTVQLDREAARNAFDLTLIAELTEVARRYRGSSSVHTIILRGADKFFSAGADLQTVGAFQRQPGKTPDLVALRQVAKAGSEMCQAWQELQPVTIAAIEGACVGAGAALSVACDFRVLGQSAFMRFPEVPLGINLSWQTIPRLVELIGPSRTKQIVMFGDLLKADQLLSWGAANAVVADGAAVETALDWAEKLASLPPLPLRMTKEAVDATSNGLNQASSHMDADQFLLTAMSEDFREGVEAFLQKRPARFRGR